MRLKPSAVQERTENGLADSVTRRRRRHNIPFSVRLKPSAVQERTENGFKDVDVRWWAMAFGQSSGPPATGKQVRELLELLEAAGHSDFRDARGPMGFSQRQAGGKFTRDEADAFIEQLESEIHGDGPPAGSRAPATDAAPVSKIVPRAPAARPRPATRSAAVPRPKAASKPTVDLGDVSSDELAAELQRRGWIVAEP